MAAIFGHIGGGLNGDGAGASGLFKSESSFFQPIATGRVPCCLVNTVHCYGSLTQQCDDIILSEFGRLHGLLGLHITQVDIIRYIDGVVKRPSSRFSADFQIEVYLVADGPGLAVLSKRQLNMFCCCNAASAGYFKILTTKYSGYRFCQLSINGTGKAYNNCLDLIRSNIIGIRIKAVGSEKPRSYSGV